MSLKISLETAMEKMTPSDLELLSIFDDVVVGNITALNHSLNKDNVNFCDCFGDTPLHLAARAGHLEIVSKLLRIGAKNNVNNYFNSTPLHEAVLENHEEVVTLLLAHQANVDMQDDNGNTPLHLAAKLPDESILKIILNEKPNVNLPNKAGKTALHCAAFYSNPASICLLVDHGANVNLKNNYGDTPLHVAAQDGRTVVLKQIIRKGADIHLTNLVGRNALQAAVELCDEFSSLKKVTSALLNAGIDLNAKDLSGSTMLEIAKNKYDEDTFRDYLEYCKYHDKLAHMTHESRH